MFIIVHKFMYEENIQRQVCDILLGQVN